MSKLTDRIAAKHQRIFNARYGLGPHCTCGWIHHHYDGSQKHVKHVAEVTEAAVRERVARDIEYAESMSRASLIERPKIGPGEFLNDWQWAARIARGGAE